MKNVNLNAVIPLFYYSLVAICLVFLLKFIAMGIQLMQTTIPSTASEMLVSAP